MSSNSILPILWWLAKTRNTLADPPFPTNSFRKLIQLLDHGRTFSEAIQSLRTNPVIRADPAFNVTLRIIQHASEKPEQKAVTLYTAQTPLYGILNALLRRPPADWNQPNFQNDFQPFAAYIPFLLDGLKNACPLHPAGLPKYRIVRGDVWHTDPQDPTPQSYQTGDMYLETTFLSASGSGDADWNNVASFAPNVNVYTRFIILNCPHGRQISGLSFHPQEDEVLFPPGIQFKVLSVVHRTPTKCPVCNNPGLACSQCGIARRLAIIEVTLNFTPTNSSPWAASGTGVDPTNVPTAKPAYTPQEYPKPPKPVEPNLKSMPHEVLVHAWL